MSIDIAIAGSTGSIGTQCLQVIAMTGDTYRVASLSAGSQVDALIRQANEVRPDLVVIGDPALEERLRAGVTPGIEVASGSDAMAEGARSADVTVNGIVGFAGLAVTLACLTAGRRLALANKESLIAAGPIVQRARRTPGAELIPVDSEHAAIHMCLRGLGAGASGGPRRVARLQITASGGPFRGRTSSELQAVTIAEALAHPTWSMGPKITIDSSTLMNKGLEVIEANELFGMPAGDAGFGLSLDDIDVVVHPQSIVHSMVTLTDGATIAQLSHPDMRLPIGYALAYPDRLPAPFGEIDWSSPGLFSNGTLTFEPPDRQAFPCLDLAFEAARVGGTAPAWLNAANEVAVAGFLKEQIRWVDIARVNESVLQVHDRGAADTLDDVLAADHEARRRADELLAGWNLN
ncbi:MAG: 1-deoxy-D-xylulose-5-phosphate reductoisomerase [Actinomycetota bacterium]|nr:1-deoxy-D-xylulose-5-phosphate reductoisomerase [Actinomycetota bacterium]